MGCKECGSGSVVDGTNYEAWLKGGSYIEKWECLDCGNKWKRNNEEGNR